MKKNIGEILQNVANQIQRDDTLKVNLMFDSYAQMMAIPAQENQLCFCGETRSVYIYQYHNWALIDQVPVGVLPVYTDAVQPPTKRTENDLLDEEEFSLFKVNILNNRMENIRW
jgi:hypothetical protein